MNVSKKNILKRMQKTLAEKKALLRECTERLQSLEKIIDTFPGLVYWVDEAGDFQGCNDALRKWLGINDIKKFIGKTYEDFFAPECASMLKRKDKIIMNKNSDCIFETPLTNKNGETKNFLSRKSPIKNEAGEIVGVLHTSI